jgi:hypothetical protein
MSALSPAAQAVLNAAEDAYDYNYSEFHRCADRVAAAALRALAEYRTPHWDGTGPACHWHPTPYVRRELIAIAAELEAPHD